MKNLKSILGVIAPTLATAIGGPLGGMAMKMVADKLGLPDASPEALTRLWQTPRQNSWPRSKKSKLISKFR
jgi:hypothetical protein